jgi:cobalt-zinc-cadmium efflux system protein
MGHDHHHHHGHDHGAPDLNRAFGLGVGLNLTFVVVEAIYGLQAHSLSLLADAGHNLGDVMGLLLAWGAGILAMRLPSARRTYGLRRTSILAALGNALLLLLAVCGITWEAIQRFRAPEPVASGVVVWVALIGIAINTGTALLFLRGRKHDLNVRAAFVHMVADAAVSAGVVVAALVILRTGWLWLDPAVSVAIALVIAVGTWGLLRDSVNLALDAVPAGIDPDQVQGYLAGLPGVTAVHDLHIWGMSTTHVAVTAHLVRPGAGDDDAMLAQAARVLHDRFGIEHSTLQLERSEEAANCKQAPPGVV